MNSNISNIGLKSRSWTVRRLIDWASNKSIKKKFESHQTYGFGIGLGFDQHKKLLDHNKWDLKRTRSNESKWSNIKNVTHESNITRDHRERLTKIDQIATKIAKPRIVLQISPWSWRPALIPIVVTKNMVWHAELKLAQLNMVIWVFKRYIECIWCYTKRI